MKKVFIVRLTEASGRNSMPWCERKRHRRFPLHVPGFCLSGPGQRRRAQTDAQVAEALSVAAKTVFNVRRRWVEQGLEAAAPRKKQDGPSRHVNSMAGRRPSWWPHVAAPLPKAGAMDLADACRKLVELQVVTPSAGNGAQHAKKNAVKPWLTAAMVPPKKHDGEFVWRMEDVL